MRPMPSQHDGLKDFVLDRLVDLRGVTARAMFGGYGLSCDGTFFGIVHKGRLYFKTNDETRTTYVRSGMKPFRPNAKQTLKSFYEVPTDVLEDAEQLGQWAAGAVQSS